MKPKVKYLTVGSVMKPFSKTKDGQEIPKEEQGNGYVSIPAFFAKDLARELMKLGDNQKLSLYLNTREEQIDRLDSVVASGKMLPATAEKIKARLIRGQDFVRFDLVLKVQE